MINSAGSVAHWWFSPLACETVFLGFNPGSAANCPCCSGQVSAIQQTFISKCLNEKQCGGKIVSLPVEGTSTDKSDYNRTDRIQSATKSLCFPARP